MAPAEVAAVADATAASSPTTAPPDHQDLLVRPVSLEVTDSLVSQDRTVTPPREQSLRSPAAASRARPDPRDHPDRTDHREDQDPMGSQDSQARQETVDSPDHQDHPETPDHQDLPETQALQASQALQELADAALQAPRDHPDQLDSQEAPASQDRDHRKAHPDHPDLRDHPDNRDSPEATDSQEDREDQASLDPTPPTARAHLALGTPPPTVAAPRPVALVAPVATSSAPSATALKYRQQQTQEQHRTPIFVFTILYGFTRKRKGE